MTCEDCEGQVSEYMDGELNGSGAGPMFAHLGTCQRCRGFMRGIANIRGIAARDSLVSEQESANRLQMQGQSSTAAAVVRWVLRLRPPRLLGIELGREVGLSVASLGLALLCTAAISAGVAGIWFHSSQHSSAKGHEIVYVTTLPVVDVKSQPPINPQPMQPGRVR